jgi:hypothetical protein
MIAKLYKDLSIADKKMTILAIKPANGGVPAIENITIANVKANKEFDLPNPFNSLI